MSGKLFIVATPIGNLADITLRAIDVLKEADLVAAEDTRVSIKLLNHLGIKKEMISFHEHSGRAKVGKIVEALIGGKNVVLITDAGTPGISDPGEALIKATLMAKIEVVPVPGPAAFVAALSASGLSTAEFVFIGFLPHKKGRQTKLKEIAEERRTIVLYESPYRIKKLLKELVEAAGDREVYVGRELTKKFEEHYRGKLSEVSDRVKEKGEFVIVLEGKND